MLSPQRENYFNLRKSAPAATVPTPGAYRSGSGRDALAVKYGVDAAIPLYAQKIQEKKIREDAAQAEKEFARRSFESNRQYNFSKSEADRAASQWDKQMLFSKAEADRKSAQWDKQFNMSSSQWAKEFKFNREQAMEAARQWGLKYNFTKEQAATAASQWAEEFGLKKEDALRLASQWRMSFDQRGSQFDRELELKKELMETERASSLAQARQDDYDRERSRIMDLLQRPGLSDYEREQLYNQLKNLQY